jgi:hypothetical protein
MNDKKQFEEAEKEVLEDEKVMLEQELTSCSSLIDSITADPASYAQAKVQNIDKTIAGRPGGPGPIKQRKVITPGHISMYDHLMNKRTEWNACTKDTEPKGIVKVHLDRITAQKAETEQRLSDVEAELSSFEQERSE